MSCRRTLQHQVCLCVEGSHYVAMSSQQSRRHFPLIGLSTNNKTVTHQGITRPLRSPLPTLNVSFLQTLRCLISTGPAPPTCPKFKRRCLGGVWGWGGGLLGVHWGLEPKVAPTLLSPLVVGRVRLLSAWIFCFV